MTAYYNEFDKPTAAWLRELIRVGAIAPGVVDERSIEDVRPDDLRGFTQCHFFAGIGVWSYALRAAGWSDDRPVWTGSCPCQPFSAAGKGLAFADERHLWPAFGHLIRECAPAIVLGEQVASKNVDAWIDLVHADVEAMGYAFGSVPFPSAGVGAPHIRDRNYWVAQSSGERRERGQGAAPRRLANRDDARRIKGNDGLAGAGEISVRLADAPSSGRREERPDGSGGEIGDSAQGLAAGPGDGSCDLRAGPTNGFWRDADWLGCTDGKWRPVEPGTFPLVTGATARVVRLRGYGNAVNAKAAQAWIETVMECI